MAQVSFTISAVDRTRAAFASINQGLKTLGKEAGLSQKKFATMTLQAVGIGSAAALIFQNVRRVATEIDRIPGIPEETIASVRMAKTAFADLRNSIDGVIAKGLAFISDVGQGLGFAIGALVYGTDAAADAMNKMKAESKLPPDFSDQLKKVNEQLAEEQLALARVNETMGASIKRRMEEAKVIRDRLPFAENELAKKQALLKATELELDATRDLNKLRAEQAKGLPTPLNDKEQVSVTAALNANMQRRVSLQREIERLNGLMMANDPNSPMYLEAVIRKQDELNKLTEDRKRLLEEQRRVAREVGDTLAGGFEDAIFSGKKLSEVVRSLGLDLMRLLFRNMITQPLANFITSGLGSLFGGPRAAGGPVSAGTSYLVGENGPEIFTASQAGRIIPNHKTGGASGGGPSYSFTYNIASGVTRAELLPALKATQRETIARIAEVQRRGMPIAAAAY